ncbi:hypothetical protein [Methylorubrum sp. GM97]|uniref:hypothetical protein n=1 Tax=Methylorubrum sp. GM97 TaxID=2938232 RepID=UPI002185DF88|nr:hypothetical protein [Methylorubrum sp. GM97]BDL41076.1 hypothetical protein MSPGM_36660 [Methylorubrum sp. GM97]
MGDPKSLAAEIEAVSERERARLIAWLFRHPLSTQTTIDREMTADALMADFIAPRLAEIAALQSRAFEDGARKGLSDALAAYDAAERELATAEAVYEETSGRMTETAGIDEIMDRIGAEEACMRCSAAAGIAQAKLVEAVRAALAPNTTEGGTDRA